MPNRPLCRLLQAVVVLAVVAVTPVHAASYLINPGDRLQVNVWGEDELSGLVVVRPDGFVSVPMAGEIETTNRTPPQVSADISRALSRFMKDAPLVVVSLVESLGNRVYVLGKVQRPGQYQINSDTDIMQALALAGGLNTFAAGDDIIVLRRTPEGRQVTIPFAYSKVAAGKNLDTNIVLNSRDVVVVP